MDKIKELEERIKKLEEGFSNCHDEIYKLKRPSKFSMGDRVKRSISGSCEPEKRTLIIVNVEWINNRWMYLLFDEHKKESFESTEYEITHDKTQA